LSRGMHIIGPALSAPEYRFSMTEEDGTKPAVDCHCWIY
jgi:hypothetical protein